MLEEILNLSWEAVSLTSFVYSIIRPSIVILTFLKRTFLGFAESGQIVFEEYIDYPVSYSYNASTDNRTDHTLAAFSTNAANKMKPCSKCEYYTEFNRYSQFYGKTDYAHQWVMAALQGNRTVFDSSTADFQNLPIEARAGTLNCK